MRNKAIMLISVVVVTATMFVGCVPAKGNELSTTEIDFIQLKSPTVGQEIATIKTTLGDIKMILFENEAPKTVAHFKKLVDSGFYNNKQVFNRKDFDAFITGATDDKCVAGKLETDDNKPLKSEITPNLWHFSGAVSSYGIEKGLLKKEMVSDSRFFMIGSIKATPEFVGEMEKYEYPTSVINAYKENGGMPQFTGYYTVFGQVIEGLDVVDNIIATRSDAENETETEGNELSDVLINSISIAAFTE